MPRIRITKGELEPATAALTAWVQCLRLGLLSSRIGMLKGVIGPLAEGVYHDREFAINDHAIWDVIGEGEEQEHRRRVKEYIVNGQKVGEEVVFKDPRTFQKYLRSLMGETIEIDVPFLLKEQDIKDSEKNVVKDGKVLPVVDFGALCPLFDGTARLVDQ